MLLSFYPLIEYGFSADADPLAAVEGADLKLGICRQLLGDILYKAGLEIEFAFEHVYGTERSYPRLIAVSSRKVVGVCRFKKIIYSLHVCSSFRLSHRADALSKIAHDRRHVYILRARICALSASYAV